MKIAYTIPAAIFAACCLLTGPRAFATPTNYWVATTGNDTTGDGSSGNPWASLQGARDHVRAVNASQTDDIIVNFEAGEYPITTTALFQNTYSGGGSDSGQNGHNIIYQSASGANGAARFVGAITQTGWTLASGSSTVYVVNIGTNLDVETLYEGSQRARVARSPHYALNPRFPLSAGPYLYTTSYTGSGSPYDSIGYPTLPSPSPQPSAWLSPLTTAAQVIWWKGSSTSSGVLSWGTDKPSQLDALSLPNQIFDVLPQYLNTVHTIPFSGTRFYVQGVYDLLQEPGEFYYDPPSGNLYYYPYNGNPNSLDIRIPTLTRLVTLQGSSTTDCIHNVQFNGLGFYYTNCGFAAAKVGDVLTQNDIDAAVYVTESNNIVLQNCDLGELGIGAIYLRDVNNSDTISGCWVHNCGMTGVFIYNGSTPSGTPAGAPSENDLVTNCRISNIGEVYCSAVFTAGLYVQDVDTCTFSYLDISNCPRYATSLIGDYVQGSMTPNALYPAYSNTFEYIRATNCMMDSGDGGIVHAAGISNGSDGYVNTWDQMIIEGAYSAEPTATNPDPQPPNGVFMDYANLNRGQTFIDIQADWTQGALARLNTGNPITNENTTNVSWQKAALDTYRLDYLDIGLKASFPSQYLDQTTVYSDDHTADYTEQTGTTWVDSSLPNLYNGVGRFHAGTGSFTVQWQPSLPYTGTYLVYAWKADNDPAATSQANYTVNYVNGSAAGTVNQQSGSDADSWVALTSSPVRMASDRSTSANTVVLSTTTSDSGNVRADALKFVLQTPDPTAIGGEVAWWRFDTVATAGVDDSGGAEPATLSSPSAMIQTDNALGGGSMLLNGSSYYATVPDSTVKKQYFPNINPLTDSFAISCWFEANSGGPGNLRLLSKGAGTDSSIGYAIYGSNSSLTVTLGNGTTRRTATLTYSAGSGTTWHQLVANFDRSGSMTLYIDGTASAPTSISDWSTTSIATQTALNIGRNSDGNNLYWSGAIDDLRLYKRVLTVQEIGNLVSKTSRYLNPP